MAKNYLHSYSAGTVLFSEGDLAETLYFLLQGTVLAFREGNREEIGKGAIFGELAFFRKGPHSYSALCQTDVKLLEITKANMTDVFERGPGLACSLLQELAQTVPVGAETLVFFQGRKSKSGDGINSWEHLLPEGHPVLEKRVSALDDEYLFWKEVICPFCGTQFIGAKMRQSRLQALKHEPDFRIIYRDFEPNFYYIWVCPQCSFAYPERQYSKISPKSVKRGKINCEEARHLSFSFDQQRTMQQVLISYYLATRSFKMIGASPQQWANLWLRLVWLYEDLNQNKLMRAAAVKALHYFQKDLSQTKRSTAGDQQIFIIMAELCLRLEEHGRAYRNLHRAVTMVGGNPRYKHMAADRIQDLRRWEQV